MARRQREVEATWLKDYYDQMSLSSFVTCLPKMDVAPKILTTDYPTFQRKLSFREQLQKETDAWLKDAKLLEALT